MLLVFILSSMLFISNSLKYELNQNVAALPQVTIQALQAGRHTNIELKNLDLLLDIQGVQAAIPRVWGYYYFDNAGVNFSVVGVDAFDKQYKTSVENLVEDFNFDTFVTKPSMLVGDGVKKILQENYYTEYFNFVKPDGSYKKVWLAGVFNAQTSLESNDMIFMPLPLVREIFGMEKNEATDIVLKIENESEIPNIINKIKEIYPESRVVSKEDMRISYENIFDYKSGVFLSLFIISTFTFFMIIYDRASGLSSEEKREIGIQKALGWKIDDILAQKFYEAFIISVSAFILGLILALFFVFTLSAPLLREVFVGYSILKPAFELPFVLDVQTLSVLFFLSVPIYIASLIIPSWIAASTDADEVMR